MQFSLRFVSCYTIWVPPLPGQLCTRDNQRSSCRIHSIIEIGQGKHGQGGNTSSTWQGPSYPHQPDEMARKATPQPLTLEESPNIIGDNHDDFIIDGSRAPLSPTSPKSPRSPFKFSSRKGNSQGDYPSMQEAELQSSKRDIPPSQAAASPTPLQHSVASGGQEGQERERSTRIGFFSNYKASKSSRSVTEDTMSRDTDRPSMSGKVSGQESNKNGKTFFVSSLLIGCNKLTFDFAYRGFRR